MDTIEVLKNRYSGGNLQMSRLKRKICKLFQSVLQMLQTAQTNKKKIIILQNEETIRKLGIINGEVVGKKGD